MSASNRLEPKAHKAAGRTHNNNARLANTIYMYDEVERLCLSRMNIF